MAQLNPQDRGFCNIQKVPMSLPAIYTEDVIVQEKGEVFIDCWELQCRLNQLMTTMTTRKKPRQKPRRSLDKRFQEYDTPPKRC